MDLLAHAAPRRRIMLLGATGTIGRATVRELAARGHEVVAFVRPGSDLPDVLGITWRFGDITEPCMLAREGFRGETFDALVSCLASRTGTAADAARIDRDAHRTALAAARNAGVRHVVLLSAICLQRPRLAFQHAKLAFEAELMASDVAWSIVRPTAYFKSLSGQVARVAAGKPYLLFGDGRLTRTKPIADEDVAAYLADCLDDPDRRNRVLPIGGPGPATTPLEQAERLFALAGRPPRYRRVPLVALDAAIRLFDMMTYLSRRFEAVAELARIGRYYASESMLAWNEDMGCYLASETPSVGSRTLPDHHVRLLREAASRPNVLNEPNG